MATFRFGRAVDIHWQGYEVVGPAGTVFSIPDQLYDEFNDDIAPVEPTLVWVDTNEFQTLSNSVSVTTLTGTIPISVTSTTSGKVISINSTTNLAGYNLVADGSGGVIFQAGSTGALTSVVGVSPISAIVSGGTVSVSLNANYQTAGSYQPSGTYVTGVVGTSPISATGTTAITVSLNANYQTAGTYVNAVIGTSPASVSTASGTSTVSIVAGSIDSSHLSATSVGSSQLINGSVTSDKLGAASVVAAKIDAGAVGSAALAANAVVAAKIDAGAVGSAALAANAVVAAKIDAGAVGSAALAANAVVAAKIAAAAVGVVAISSGTSTSGTLLTADGAGGAAFSPAPPGGGMVLISSVSVTSGNTNNIGFVNIPQTYTVLHLIGQFYVTATGETYIQVNPSTSTSAIGGTTGFASKIFHISKTTDNGITTFGTGNNNMEGSEVESWFCTVINQQNRYMNFSAEISNYRALGPISMIGFQSRQNAGKYVGFTWGEARNSPPAMKTLWVSGNFNLAIFRLYGS